MTPSVLMTEAQAIRWFRDLGFDRISYTRQLSVRGAAIHEKTWTCQISNGAQFARESNGRRRKTANEYPSIVTISAGTRARALYKLIVCMVERKGRSLYEDEAL